MRYRLRTLLILMAVGPPMLVVAGDDTQGDAVKQELQKLRGDWLLVYWRFDGKEQDAAKEQTVMTFTGKEFSIRIGDKVHEEGTVLLDPSTSPFTFDHIVTAVDGKPADRHLPGIYLLQDDILIVCVGYRKAKPTAFSADADSLRELVIYRRIRK